MQRSLKKLIVDRFYTSFFATPFPLVRSKIKEYEGRDKNDSL